MASYGVGVYGIGWVAGEHIKAFQDNPDTHVVAIASRNKDSAIQAKACLDLDCQVVDDFESLVNRADVDIIDLCTPNFLHAREAVAGARAGKHLVVEKPIVMNPEELKELQEAVTQAGVLFQTGFVLRFHPYYQTVKQMIDQGAIGDVFFTETDYYHEIGPWWSGYKWGANTRQYGPSATLVAGCHAVDLLSWLGGEVEEVFAYGTIGHRTDYEYEPTYTACVKFTNGTIGKTGASFENECPYFINTVIHGSQGSIFNEKFFTKKWFSGQKGWQTFNTIMPESGDVSHHPFKAMMADLTDALNERREPVAGLTESVRTHELCLAIDQSIATGKPVRLPLL